MFLLSLSVCVCMYIKSCLSQAQLLMTYSGKFASPPLNTGYTVSLFTASFWDDSQLLRLAYSPDIPIISHLSVSQAWLA